MIPLITYIQTRISQLILLKFYKAQEGRRTNKPKKTTTKQPPRPPKTLQCLVISLHAFPPLASIPWRICLCVPVDLSEGVLTDALHLILMLFMHLLYCGNSSLHRKTQPQQQRAKEFGCIHNPWFRPRRSGSLFSKVRIPALNCPLSRPLSIEVDQDVNLLEDFSSHSS